MTCPDHHCPECRRVYAAEFITWLVLLVFLGAILAIVSGCGAQAEGVIETGELEQVYEGPEGWCCTEGDSTECGMSEHVAFEWQRYRELSGRDGECTPPMPVPADPSTLGRWCCERIGSPQDRSCGPDEVWAAAWASAWSALDVQQRCWAVP